MCIKYIVARVIAFFCIIFIIFLFVADGGSMSEKITNTILFMICKDMIPVSIVELEGFRALLKLTVPLYKTPSKKTMTRRLEARYNIMKTDFIKTLETVPHYCVTADNWTDCSNQSYMGLTIHYLDSSLLKMKSGFLGCFPLNDRHTAQYLKECINNIFEEFKIREEKLTGIITDGEAAIKKMCIDLFGNSKHIICLAHATAHLLPQSLNNFPELTTIIDKVKAIVTLIRRSIPASDKLKDLQVQDGKSEGTTLKLKQDVPTRWTTKIDMLERYIQLESYVYVAMGECDNPVDVLIREEMKILKDVLPIMEPIRSVITEISGDTYPTSSMIIPILNCMRRKIDSIIPNTDIGREFKGRLQSAMESRFKVTEYNSLLRISTILDPRYKKLHFKDPNALARSLTRIREKIEEVRTQGCNKIIPIKKITSEKYVIFQYYLGFS